MKWSLADEIPDSDSGEELTPAQQATSRKRAQQARAAMEELREIGERIDAGKPLVHDQNTEGTASTPDTPAPPEIPDPASDGDPTAAIDEDQLNQISVLTRMAAPVEEDEKPTRPQRPTRTKKSTWKRSKAKKTPAKGGEE